MSKSTKLHENVITLERLREAYRYLNLASDTIMYDLGGDIREQFAILDSEVYKEIVALETENLKINNSL